MNGPAAQDDQPAFVPAAATAVSEVTFPPPAGKDGTVVLNALVTSEGKPDAIEVRRGIEGLTGLASAAIEAWTFTPALRKGKSVASRIAVAVNFHPPLPFANPQPLPPPTPQSDDAIQAEFQPADIIHDVFPVYPGDSTALGTVVFEVRLDARGKMGEVKVLQGIAPLTASAQAALANWRFRPASDNGTPVASDVVIAFVFPPWVQNNN